MSARLITLVFSHYNDKARWALELAGLPFVERPYLPGFSSLAVAMATGGRGGRADRVSSRFSTPVLRTEEGEVLSDSTDILRYADGRGGLGLFEAAGAGALVDHYSDQIGPYTRLAAYWLLLPQSAVLDRLAVDNVGTGQVWAFRAAAPLAKGYLRRGLGLTQARYDKALQRVRGEMDEAADRLEGQPYLAGDRFSAADLTFAAMLSPVLCVQPEEGHGAVLPPVASMDEGSQALVAELRAHPAGQHALRMYAQHRG